MAEITYLSQAELEGLDITTADAMSAIERVIHGKFANKTWSAPKAVLHPPDGRYVMATLSASDDPPFIATKSLLLNPRNPERGLPQINSIITLLDSETGIPVAVMDGNWITGIRTAALSAVAAAKLARKDASSLAFIGAGVQASTHLKAFADLFPLAAVKIFSRGRANMERLRDEARAIGLEAIICDSAREAVSGVDLLVTSVTLGPQTVPFLDANWLAPGSFTAGTDIAAPWHKDTFTAFDRLLVDDLEQEQSLPNKLADPDLITGDLAGLVLGQASGRNSDDERTAFLFRGHPLGDIALAALAFEMARKSGVGRTVNL